MLNIKRLIADMNKIALQAKRLSKPSISSSELRTGLEVSRQALTSKLQVNLTPYTANMLKELDGTEELKPEDPMTKMERYLETCTKDLLHKYVGGKTLKYDLKGDPCSFANYCVDC